jgi:Protein of unknown function (DUF3489)
VISIDRFFTQYFPTRPIKHEGGTTLEEIMAAMGWQKHTTRAMLSAGGSLTKKHGLIVASEKVGEKRIYSIKA